jgi:hypothetical protein
MGLRPTQKYENRRGLPLYSNRTFAAENYFE